MSNFDDMWDAAPEVAEQQPLSFDDMWNSAPVHMGGFKVVGKKSKQPSFDDMWNSVPDVPQPEPVQQAPVPTGITPPKFDLWAGFNDYVDQVPIVKETRQQWSKGWPGVTEQAATVAAGIPAGITSVADSIDALMMAPGKAIAHTFDPVDMGRDEGFRVGGLSDYIQPPADLTQSFDNMFGLQAKEMPATYGFGKGIGQFLLPAGGGGASKGFGDAALKGAGLGAATGGVTNLAEQAKAEHFDPFELAASTVLGAGFGAGGSTAVHGLGELVKRFLRRKQQTAQLAPQQPQPEPAAPSPAPVAAQESLDLTGSAQAQQSADDIFNSIFNAPKAAPIAKTSKAPMPSESESTKGFFGNMRRYNQGVNGHVDVTLPSELERDLIALGSHRTASGKKYPAHLIPYLAKQLGIPEDQVYGVAYKYAQDLKASVRDYHRSYMTDARSGKVDPMVQPSFSAPSAMPKPAAPEPQGVFRHQRTAFGRNKVDEALPIDQFDEEIQAAVNEIAQHKAILDGHKALMNAYAQKVWDKLQAEGKVGEIGTYKGLTRQESKRSARLSSHAEQELAKYRESLAHDVDKSTAKQHVATVLGSNYGVEGPHGLKLPPLELAETPEQAIESLKKMKRSMNEAQNAYDEAKKRHQPTLERAQAKQRETEPTASFNARTKVKTPFGDEVDAAVSLDHNAMRLKLTKEAEQLYDKAKSEKMQQAALDRNKVPKFEFDVKLARKALGVLTGAYLVSNQAAQAADGSKKEEDKTPWGTVRMIGEVTLGAALMYKFAPEKARAFLNSRRTVAGAVLYKDTLQRLKAYDALTGRGLARKVEMVGGQSQAKNFGVKFDDPQKVFDASQALRDLEPADLRNLTANPSALNLSATQKAALGKAFQGLSQEQRNAIIFNEQARRNLGSALAKELKHAEELVTKLESRAKAKGLNHKQASARLRDSVSALKYMSEAVNGKGTSHPLEDWYNNRLSAFMQYNFFLNPAFEATNLTDMFISGASSTGLGNLGKALKLLGPGGDAQLKKLYQNSNLAGGLEAIKHEVAQATGHAPKKPLVDFPIKSDKVNADRVSLAAHLQYANQYIAANLKGPNAYHGTDVQFVKDLLENKLDPSVGYDAWAHHFQTLSRSLGVDNFRVNTDFISSHPVGKYLGVLMRQPARIANLQMKYIANEEWGKLFTMMGAITVLGGRAVIPKEVEIAWQNLDGEAYFQAASILDILEPVRYLTGKSLNGKIQSALIPMVAAARDPIGGAMVKSFDDVKDFMQQPGKDKARSFITALAQLYFPVVKNIPTRLGINAFKNADEAFFSGMPIYFFDAQGKNYGKKMVVKPDNIGISSKVHGTGGQFIAGDWVNVDRIQQQKLEAVRRKKSPLRFLGINDGGTPYYDSGRVPSFLGQFGIE